MFWRPLLYEWEAEGSRINCNSRAKKSALRVCVLVVSYRMKSMIIWTRNDLLKDEQPWECGYWSRHEGPGCVKECCIVREELTWTHHPAWSEPDLDPRCNLSDGVRYTKGQKILAFETAGTVCHEDHSLVIFRFDEPFRLQKPFSVWDSCEYDHGWFCKPFDDN